MREEFVPLLACPDCSGGVALSDRDQTSEDGHVMSGALRCKECDAKFPIEEGVPLMLPRQERRARIRENTAERFAYEWTEFSDFDVEEEEKSLTTWMQPNALDRFEGQVMFEAGCGMGRHSVIACRHGVQQHVGLDLGSSVWPAFKNTRHLRQVCIVQGDIFYPPLREGAFDAGISIGVLHHTPDPKRSLAALAPKVRVGGWFHAWVYGREGNGWIVYLVNPVRWITARMPLVLVKLMSWPLALVLWLMSRSIYRLPLLSRVLPYGDYIRWLRDSALRKTHAIVLDHLLAPVAYYMSRDDVIDMVTVPGWSIEHLYHNRRMSWGVSISRSHSSESEPTDANSAGETLGVSNNL